jgi:small subunit ribosomal protein S25e
MEKSKNLNYDNLFKILRISTQHIYRQICSNTDLSKSHNQNVIIFDFPCRQLSTTELIKWYRHGEFMGGVKKKPAASSNKGSSGPGGEEKKADTTKKSSTKPLQKQKSSVIMDEGQGMKSIRLLKPITSQALARATGVKISVANSFLRSLETKGVVKAIAGYSGHKIYQVATT